MGSAYDTIMFTLLQLGKQYIKCHLKVAERVKEKGGEKKVKGEAKAERQVGRQDSQLISSIPNHRFTMQ